MKSVPWISQHEALPHSSWEAQLLCLKPHPCVLTGLGPTCGGEEGGDCVLSEGAPASLLPDSKSPWLAPTSERAKVVEKDGMDLPPPISPTPYPAPAAGLESGWLSAFQEEQQVDFLLGLNSPLYLRHLPHLWERSGP